MPEVRVTVGSRIGLHARPATILARAAARAAVPVRIGRASAAEETADAGSLLALMALGLGAGEEVVLSAEGEGAEGVACVSCCPGTSRPASCEARFAGSVLNRLVAVS